ncbi:MAG: glycosyltransferase family 2 protein [Planctomycetota bacterium]
MFADFKTGTPQKDCVFVGTTTDLPDVVDASLTFIWLGYDIPISAPRDVTWVVPENDCVADLEILLSPADIVTIPIPVDRDEWKPSGKDLLNAPWYLEIALAVKRCLPENRTTLAENIQTAGLYVHAQNSATVNIGKALACGIPCVVDWQYSHLVTDGWDGLVTNIENPDELRATLLRADDDELRARLAVPARTSSQRWDAKTISDTWQRLLALDWPKVSVVLPTCNRAHLIGTAIENVLNQQYPNFEVIVVNDGSSDGTRDVLDEFDDPRLRVIHKDNERLPKALNTGFEAATGEFLTWTSDDNTFKDGALKAMARELVLNPDTAMVYANYAIDGETVVETGPTWLLKERNLIGACFMYRKSAAIRAGQYDPDLELAEDYDYWLRLNKIGQLSHLPRTLYNYGDAPDSLTRQMPVEVQMATLKLLEREREHDADWPAAREELLKKIAMQLKEQGKSVESLAVARQLISMGAANMAGYKAALRALTPSLFLKAFRSVKGLK